MKGRCHRAFRVDFRVQLDLACKRVVFSHMTTATNTATTARTWAQQAAIEISRTARTFHVTRKEVEGLMRANDWNETKVREILARR